MLIVLAIMVLSFLLFFMAECITKFKLKKRGQQRMVDILEGKIFPQAYEENVKSLEREAQRAGF